MTGGTDMIFMIARVYEKGNLVGFRLIDTSSNKMVIASYASVKNAISAGTEIENLKLENNKLSGKSGSIERYTAIDISGEPISKSSVVILSKNEDRDRYTLVDYRGKVAHLDSEELIRYAYVNTIANGKLVKRQNGKLFISPIEGEYKSDERLSLKPKMTKKYKVPNINKNQQFNGVFSYCTPSTFKKKLAEQLKEINPQSYVIKHGIHFAGGDKQVTGNDILKTQFIPSTYCIGIVEIRYSECSQFVMYFNDKVKLLVDDILYIGKAWASIAKHELCLSENINDGTIIAIGQIGLIVIKYINNEIKKYCIPYCKIDTIEKLTNQLVKYGITTRMLEKSDIVCILNAAKNSIYQLNFNINLDDLYSYSNEYDRSTINPERQGVVKKETVSIINVKRLVEFSSNLQLDLYARDMIANELDLGIEQSEIAYFTHSIQPIIHMDSDARVIVQNELVKLSYRTLDIKYIAYLILYKNKKIDTFKEAWIPKNIWNKIDEMIWGQVITDDNLILYINDTRLTFDINILNKIYTRDLQEIEETTKKAVKLNRKLGLVGSNITLNEAGYIIDWGDKVEIEQNNTIKGIEITDDNYSNAIQIKVSSKFDIRDSREIYKYSTAHIEIIYYSTAITDFKKALREHPYNCHIAASLKEASADGIDKIISLYLRKFDPAPVYINGEYIRINNSDMDFSTQFFIANATKLFDIGQTSTKFTNSRKSNLYDLDKVDQTEKYNFIKRCIAGIPKRPGASQRKAIEVFEFILSQICNNEEQRAIKMGLNNYLKSR